jgi:hypothetical protein
VIARAWRLAPDSPAIGLDSIVNAPDSAVFYTQDGLMRRSGP